MKPPRYFTQNLNALFIKHIWTVKKFISRKSTIFAEKALESVDFFQMRFIFFKRHCLRKPHDSKKSAFSDRLEMFFF
jgi:hypothetical protein